MKEEWKQLGSIADIYNGDSINAEYKKTHFVGLEEGYPFIATKDVSPEGAVDYNNGVKIPADAGLKVAPSDSVFVCAEGGSAGKKIAYIEQEVCFGNKLFCIATKDKTKYSSKYIYYFCRSEKFRNQFFGELTGLIGGVSSKKFKGIECPFPHLSEQEKIVSYLDAQFAKIDALKANAASQLQAAKDLFQSALKEYLAPKEGWEKKTMTEIIDRGTNISYGIVQPGEGCQNGIPVVRPVDLRSKYIDSLEGLKKTTPEISNSYTRSILNGKEILMCVRGTTGVVSLSTDVLIGCNVTRGIVPFKISNDTLRNFVYYSIGAPLSANFIQSKTQGAALKQINIADVKQIPVYLPSLKEQRDIVVILDTLSEKVKVLQKNYDQTITLCNDLKQSLLKSIFE